jgi:transposase
MNLLCADVSKDELTCFDGVSCFSQPNQPGKVRRLVSALAPDTAVAMEATGSMHFLLADTAHAMGHLVYVLNPRMVSRYRAAVASSRGKTDLVDARLIHRLVANEFADLRPYEPAPIWLRSLLSLVHKRGILQRCKASVRLSFGSCEELKGPVIEWMQATHNLTEAIDAKVQELVKASGQVDRYQRIREIKGVGDVVAPALFGALCKGSFVSADAFVSFLGLGVKERQSGKWKGKAKLTKEGDSEIRRLLYLAAMAGCRAPEWKGLYQRYLQRMKRTQALVALARKIARTAWSIFTHGTRFTPDRIHGAA